MENKCRLIGNSDQLDLAERLISRGREPHSVMICGERGSGKRTFAAELCARLLCERRDDRRIARGEPLSCGVCRQCRLVAEGVHPDVVFAKAPESGNYKADDIRALVGEAYVSPSEGRYRIFIIPDLDRSPQTLSIVQNILLKAIEEPPASSVMILTARSKEIFLDTIISRTLCFTLVEVEPAAALAELKRRGCDEIFAEEAVRRCGGNIGRCLEYCADENIRAAAGQAAEICRALADSDEYRLLCAVSGGDGKKQQFTAVCEFLQRLVSDSIRVRAGVGGAFVYSQEVCRAMAAKYSEKRLAEIYDAAFDCAARATANCLVSTLVNSLTARLAAI